MPEAKCSLTATFGQASRTLVDLETAGRLTGVHPDMILQFARAGLVGAAFWEDEDAPYFDDDDIYRLRQIEHLRNRQGLHLRTVRMIIHLLERAEAAERELRMLRELFR